MVSRKALTKTYYKVLFTKGIYNINCTVSKATWVLSAKINNYFCLSVEQQERQNGFIFVSFLFCLTSKGHPLKKWQRNGIFSSNQARENVYDLWKVRIIVWHWLKNKWSDLAEVEGRKRQMEGLGFHLMEVSSVTLQGRHHVPFLCGPGRDTRSASGKPVETEETQVLILDSFGDAQSEGGWWCKERQKKKIEGERQKCDGIRACGSKSNCLLPSPSLGRQDVAWHLYPGSYRTMATGTGHFSAPLSPPNHISLPLSSASLSRSP